MPPSEVTQGNSKSVRALANPGQAVGVLLNQHSKALGAALGLDPSGARIEVQCLLQTVLQVNRAWLLTYPEQLLDDSQHARYMALLERRLGGEPIAYLLGEREFYGLAFKVTPATLIPRPETELLVEMALQRIPPAANPLLLAEGTLQNSDETAGGAAEDGRKPRSVKKLRVLDLGTGSGAIALGIAHARPDIEVVAVDASSAALEVARLNMQRFKLGNVRLLHSDWFSALCGEQFDMIVSNPPYIAADDAHLTQGDVRFEPRAALASGADGLEDIRHIVVHAKAHLNVNGWLLFEHGYDQAARVRTLLRQAGFSGVFSSRDLAGIERISGGAG